MAALAKQALLGDRIAETAPLELVGKVFMEATKEKLFMDEPTARPGSLEKERRGRRAGTTGGRAAAFPTGLEAQHRA